MQRTSPIDALARLTCFISLVLSGGIKSIATNPKIVVIRIAERIGKFAISIEVILYPC